MRILKDVPLEYMANNSGFWFYIQAIQVYADAQTASYEIVHVEFLVIGCLHDETSILLNAQTVCAFGIIQVLIFKQFQKF